MEFKTLEQTKEDMARLMGYTSWEECYDESYSTGKIIPQNIQDHISKNYAKQFKNSLSQLLVVISEGYVKSCEGGFEEWEKELAKVTGKCKLLVESFGV